MNLFIDIESSPSQHPDARNAIRQTIKPPGTLKKPESIAAWYQTESESAIDDAWRKQSLDGGLHGEIIAIAIAGDEGDGHVFCRRHGDPEALVLQSFADTVQALLVAAAGAFAAAGVARLVFESDPYFIAHNAAFDLPFIWHRCLVNRVRLPFRFPRPSAREGKDYGCTMVQWAGYGKTVSLDSLCRALSIPSPKGGDITGAGVFDAWKEGRYAAISEYNLADALACREIWHRLMDGV